MTNLLFKKVDYTIGKLLEDIAIGDIGLPDIQRPFVWDTARVRAKSEPACSDRNLFIPSEHILDW